MNRLAQIGVLSIGTLNFNRDRWNFNIEAFGIWFFWSGLVAITNKMEFYPMPSHICQYKERFNSQRDGILQISGFS